jgi:hypothetical protein
MKTPPEDPRPAFDYALRNCPQELQVTNLEDVLLSTSRARPGEAPPRAEIALSEEQVKNLRGLPARRDLVLIVRIPRAVVERSRSRIILPSEGLSP